MIEWLTAEQIEGAVSAMSADDLIEGQAANGGGSNGSSVLMVKFAFNRAAARAGLGDDAMTRVKAADFKYLAGKVAEVFNVDSPLSADTEVLLTSADTGA